MNIRYLSLFSGIEAATVAWEPLGAYLEGKMELYRCRTRNGLWRVTTSTEYDDGYKC